MEKTSAHSHRGVVGIPTYLPIYRTYGVLSTYPVPRYLRQISCIKNTQYSTHGVTLDKISGV